MIVYIPMILITVFFAKYQKNAKGTLNKFVIFTLSFLPAVLVAAFRYNNGTDYLMYYRMFSIVGNGGNLGIVQGKTLEPGFKYLVILCQKICKDPWFTFGVIAFVIIAFIFKGCLDNSEDYVLSIILFFVSGIYFDSFNGLRQFIAVAIFFYGIKYISNRNLKRYLTCCAVAFLFHKSVLFVVPLYFIQYLKIDLKKAFAISSITFFSASIIYQIVSFFLKYTPYAYFLNSEEFKQSVTNSSAILFLSVNTVIGYIYYVKYKRIETKIQLYFNMHIVFLIVALLTTMVPLISRFLYYGYLIEILYIPSMLKLVKKKKTRQLIEVFIVTLYLVINLYGMYFNGWYDCIPYTFYF